jgi:hypothetical protein
MRAFADLYRELDSATATRHKIEALKAYLAPIVSDSSRWGEAAWAIYLLAGGKPRQMIPTRILRRLAQEATGLPEWLVEESYQNVGDLAETLSLLLPPARTNDDVALEVWMNEPPCASSTTTSVTRGSRLMPTRSTTPTGSCFSSLPPARCASASPRVRSCRL